MSLGRRSGLLWRVKWMFPPLLFFVAVSRAAEPDFDRIPAFQPEELVLKLSVPKKRFFLGETIPATLTFLNQSGKPYEVFDGKYRPEGRPADIAFLVRDETGAVLPTPPSWYFERSLFIALKDGSGLGSPALLKEWSITVPVNDWARFRKPGVYSITARAERVRSGQSAKEKIPLISTPVEITIDPITPEQEGAVIDKNRVIVANYLKERTLSEWPRDEGVVAAANELASRWRRGCYKDVLAKVFEDFWEPSALPVVKSSLDDIDPEVAVSAAEVLCKYGSGESAGPVIVALERIRKNGGDGGVMYRSSNLAKELLEHPDGNLDEAQKQRLKAMIRQ